MANTAQDTSHTLSDTLASVGLPADPAALNGAVAGISDTINQAWGQMDMTSLLALAAALGWASGLRLYAVVFFTGLAGYLDWISLPGALGILQSPIVLFFSAIMLLAEFFADKIPGVDSLWDLLQSVIRVPAGAALAAAVFGADNGQMALIAALMGGTLAATSQVAKTTTRAAINTSPEPFTNFTASLTEDGLSIGAIWLALTNPVVFFVLLLLIVLLMWLMTWWMFQFLRAAWRKLQNLLGRPSPPASAPSP